VIAYNINWTNGGASTVNVLIPIGRTWKNNTPYEKNINQKYETLNIVRCGKLPKLKV